MKKIVVNFILFLFLILIAFAIILSTIGIETKKFNKIISDEAARTKNIYLELNKIKFKLDPKKLSLFLKTQNPSIIYKNISIPVQNIKVYVDFISLVKSNPKIKKANIVLDVLDVSQLNKLTNLIKPSNFKTLLNNKIQDGKLISEVEIFLNKEGSFKNFIARGNVKDLKAELINGLFLTNTNFSFFADKNDVLVKNIFGDLEDIKIEDGDIKLNFDNGVKIDSNFNSKLDLNKNNYNKYSNFLKKFTIVDNLKVLKAEFRNNFSIKFDNTYKVKDYIYNLSGNLNKGKFYLLEPIKSNFINEKIKEIYLSDFQIQTVFLPKNISIKGNGKYSFDNLDFFQINLKNNFNKDELNLKLDLDYRNSFKLDLINYEKPKNSIAQISLDLKKKKNFTKINQITFREGNNLIKVDSLDFKNDKFLSFKKIDIKTKYNNFYILNDKKIFIKGSKFDATNLTRFLNKQSEDKEFKELNGEVEIDFKKIRVPMSEKLENFKLLGEINNGKFSKISSKGDFGGGNFLDMSLKKNKDSEKKYLEIYSDLTRPLLTEYSFFNGLSGGELLFTSIIDGPKSSSKLKIENFKVINAPGIVQLLSLADLGGLADLAEGEGLSFDILEIKMEKNKNYLKLNEILALGPSMSVLMEGYQDENGLTSLRGTLVPAKTLNKMIAKIPVIGDIVIPKDVGEGLFGVSFKMKGPKGKIKTTINPIRTLTPRFIQKIVDRNKETK
tara:strand:- start:3589 stop:5760 length:2172 start_codon:yes stop_codon:yes gene_type:complete